MGAEQAEDADALILYRLAVARGWQPEQLRADLGLDEDRFERALKQLRDLNLLRLADGRDDPVIVVSPDVALADTVGPLKKIAADADQLVVQANVRTDAFRSAYRDARRERDPNATIDRVESAQDAGAILAELLSSGVNEVLIAQPDPAAGELVPIPPGVEVRAVYPHAARTNPAARARLSAMAARGVKVRTVAEVSGGAVVVEQQAALLAQDGWPLSGPAVLLQEPTAVAHLHRLIELQWVSGSEWDAADAEAGVDEHLKESILRLLFEGHKDEVVARRLGMSVRSCRRHIAEVMDHLGASSRFQAGVLAERAGLLG